MFALVLSSLTAPVTHEARAQALPTTVTILRRTAVRVAPEAGASTIANVNPSTFEVTELQVKSGFVRLLLAEIDRRRPSGGYGYIDTVDVAVDSATSTIAVRPQKDTVVRARPTTVVPDRPAAPVAVRPDPVVTAPPASPARMQTAAPPANPEETAIRVVLARFYQGWNEHDADKMVSTYAEDVDHINVFAEWRRGREPLRADIREFLAGPGRNSRKTYTIEKIRFLKPDVAVVQVRSLSTVGNIGTYVMTKDTGQWLVVSFTNVGYQLDPSAPSTGITAPAGPTAPTAPAATPSAGATIASTTIPVPGRCEERRTGAPAAVGCYLAGTESFGVASTTPLYWHIDRYSTRSAADAARPAHGTVVEAHGRTWLFTLADSAFRSAAGAERIARVGPLPVTPGRTYAAHYLESVVPLGARTPVHRHAGPEAWYLLEGAQCLEMPNGARIVRAGESYVVPEGPPMLLVSSGTVTRRTFALVLHDAAQPWTIPTSEWTPKERCPR